jgi:hypothetical protein
LQVVSTIHSEAFVVFAVHFMKAPSAVAICLLFAFTVSLAEAPAKRPLKALFLDPPKEYSLEPFWAWNGTLERDKLVRQIDQMVEKGIYGAYMHARDGLDQSRTPYFSDGFWDAVKTSVDHGAQVGFRTWIYDEDKWPSGDAGGRTRAANPERYTATGLAHRYRDVQGPANIQVDYPQARFVIAARKISDSRIDSATLVDLTDLNRQKSEWAVPQGEWCISLLEPVRRPQPLPNYLNPDAVHEFIQNTYEQYASRFSQQFGKTIPGSFFDEIYNVNLAWDPLLEDRFRKEKGYELRKVLPLLFQDGGPETIKVRCDYFEVLTRQYEAAWFIQLSEWCARHNLKLTGHTLEELSEIPTQGDYFRTWRHAQIPGTDNEDFRYTFPRTIGSWKPKQLSSLTHVYEKPRAMVEALGGAGWTITLDQARYGVNMLAVYGINSFVFHLFHYAEDTPQSMDDWPNSWFYRNPYWKYFGKLSDYVRRLSFMGSQGEHVADIAVLYPVEEVWSRGLAHPLPSPPTAVSLVDRLVRSQLDCDLVDTDSVIRAVPAAGGRAKIGAESYRALVLPQVATVSLAAYRRIAELAGSGLKVFAVGLAPRNSAENGGDDPEVIRISERLFPSGSGLLRTLDDVVPSLRATLRADVLVERVAEPALHYTHRRIQNRDAYFLTNSEPRGVSARISFAAAGGAERWSPESGASTRLAPVDSAGHTFDLDFLPWEAFYVVFDKTVKPPAARTGSRQEKEPAVLNLDGPWTFQVAPTELDDRWSADPGETRLEVPVIEFRLQTGDADRLWRKVKIADALNPLKGAARYLSRWDAAWITRYFYSRNHPGELAGPDLRFSREWEVPFEPDSAQIELVADGKADCSWNGKTIATDIDRLKPVTLTRLPASRGKNHLVVNVKGAGYLLAQGLIRGKNGVSLAMRSDRDWTVTAPGKPPLPAYEFAFPPFGTWGEPGADAAPGLLPATGWYRLRVPPGAISLEPPQVRGEYDVALDDRRLNAGSSEITLPRGIGDESVLQLRVALVQPEDGLRAPLVFHCSRQQVPLGDWGKLGLDWYSGRGVYSTEFTLPVDFSRKRLTLDLGVLCYTGEVWLNGQLAGTLAWPPYQLDITRSARAGVNRIVVVAANLLANRMRWDIFDAAVSLPVSRWWHDGNILRDSDKLTSGLLGPVRILAAAPQ